MDWPRDCHTEWSKSGAERQIYDSCYMWNLKRKSTNELSYKTVRVADVENKATVIRGWGGNKLGNWDWHIHITMYKMNN